MRDQNGRVRVAGLAQRQFGRISWPQLQRAGIHRTTVSRWSTAGYLHRVLPRVYAVGHTAPSVEADLSAALLYAGTGAMLSHATAAWWLGLIDRRPELIEVSTPGRARCLPSHRIRVHARFRDVDRIWHRNLPATPVDRTLLDYAAKATFERVRRALAEAEYLGLLKIPELEATLKRGRAGSTLLRRALAAHQPELAVTRSELERRFVRVLREASFPQPILNPTIAGMTVDALWEPQRLIVELDGHRGHRTRAQTERDRNRELRLRAQGYSVVRYTWKQLIEQPGQILADLIGLID